MKSIKLLAALAIPAMFAACTSEDLFTVNNAPQQMEEVVGTKLVGTDISMGAIKGDAETRLTINGNWEKTDLIGLGWIASDPTVDQSSTTKPNVSTLYANHMFSYDETADEFTSKGNIYEGWYFAYYPWTYEKKVGQKYIAVNPAQTSKEVADRMSQGLHISNLQFISSDKLTEDNSLNSPFQLYGAVSYLQVRTTPTGEFAAEGELANLPITSVNISAGEEIFVDTLKVAAKNLSVYEAESSDEDNLAGAVGTNVLVSVKNPDGTGEVIGRKDSISTDVTGAGYVVSEEKTRLITIVRPYTAALNKEDIVIEVVAGAGKFVVKYVADAEEGSLAAANNAAIDALVAAYATNGKLTTTGNVQSLNLELYGDIYVTDFSNIANIDDWNDAVDLVDALGRTEETFTIVGNIEFNDTIPMPETCSLTVKVKSDDDLLKNKFILVDGEFYGWPEKLTPKVHLTIGEDATLYNANDLVTEMSITNNGTMVAGDGTKDNILLVGSAGKYALNNNGTIKLGKYAKAHNVKNDNGRIEIVYGSYVELNKNSQPGEIAYVVLSDDVAKPSRIQNVINTTTSDANAVGYAQANILIFDAANLTTAFDFTATIAGTEGEEDPYNPTEGTGESTLNFEGLENVSIEINNIEVKSSNSVVTVKDVTMTGEKAKLSGVNIVGDLNVTDGGSVACETITGNVTTDGDVTATTITGDVTATDSKITATTIDGNVIIDGTCELVVETITDNLTITSGTNTVTGTNIGGNVQVASGSATFTDINIAGDLENKGETTIGGTDAVIDNVTNYNKLYANTNITLTTISHEYGCLTEVQTTSETEYKTIWYTQENGSVEKVGSTRKGEVKYLGAEGVLAAVTAAIAEGGEVVLPTDLTLDAYLAIDTEVTLDLNGKTVDRAGAVVVAQEGATITITGNGTINAETREDGKSSQAIFANGGDVIIENGTFTCDDDNADKRNDMIYAKEGTITINGGTFEYVGSNSDGAKYMLNCLDNSGAKIIVNGGKFKNCVPSYEAVGTDEVVLGEGKKVYNEAGVEVSSAHSGTDMWYEVR